MSDLIDRQAAIANINKAIPEWSEDKEIAIDCLKNTPSAQPESTIGQLNTDAPSTKTDLISRQAAIKALDDEITITGKTNAIVVKDYVQRVKRKLEQLPSVQPERKTGRWIEFDRPWWKCSECGAVRKQMTFMEYFCPNCGADMRGEEGEDNERA